MANTTEKLILELQAKIAKYNRDILDATKKTEQFQKKTAKAFSSIEKDAKKADKSLTTFSKNVKKSFDNVGRDAAKGASSLKAFSTKSKKSLTSVRKDTRQAATAVNKLSAAVKKVPKKLDLKADLNAKKIKAFNSELGELNQQAKRANGSLFRFSNVAKGVFAALGTREIINFADSITLADNQLRNVTANAEQFNFVQMELNRIANETRQDVNELTGVFARFTRAGQEAGISQQELLGFTENLTKAFKLEGNTTAEVNSTLVQLSQSFRKGRIDGEEFRALSENSTIALQALAKQLGVTIGELKDLGAQGKIAPKDLIDGLKGVGDQIEDEFSKLEPTFAELGTRLGNLFALGFRGGALEETVSTFKRKLFETADDIERFFTGVENKTAEQLEALIKKATETRKGFLGLQETTGLDYGSAIRNVTQDIQELEIRLKSARVAAKGTDTPAVAEEKRKPLVTFGAPEDKIVAQGARRLTIIEEQAEAERQLLAAAGDAQIAEAEARAILANQVETDRLNEQFQRTLERLETNQAQIDELKALASEVGIEKLTEDEQKLLDLAQRAADAKVAITEKQEAKLAKIRDIAKRNELITTLSTGGRVLAAISNLAKKGTAIQKDAARASIIFNTASGIVRQFADLPFPAAVGTSIAIGLEGAAALASIGGGGGSPSVSVAESPTEEDALAEEATPTLDVSVSDISEESTSSGRLILDASAGTSSDQFLADAFNDAVRTGRITGRSV